VELTMPYQTISVQPGRHAMRLTLDRPDRQNSIDDAVIAEIHRALDEAERDPNCRLVLLTGRDGVFSTGMDMAAAAGSAEQPGAAARVGGAAEQGGAAFFGLLKRFSTLPRAVVSTVDGRVAGGGVGLVAASDFVYATEQSTFSLPEALWGLLPCCVLPFLIRRVGFQRAYTMTMSTQPVGAREAARSHLVDEVTDDPAALVRRLAYRLTKLDASVIADMKQYFRRLWILSDEVERTAVDEFGRLMSSPAVRDRIADYAANQRFPWER
jgi:polyketide biosynthesis enoyl-CoA hydratase PksH